MQFDYLLTSTGGGPGGGWNSSLGFRRLSRGFSIWISDDTIFKRRLTINRPLTWRTACQSMRSFQEGWIPSDYRTGVLTEGITGWQAELLVLSSLNDYEESFSYAEIIDKLLKIQTQDLQGIWRSSGYFYKHETLQSLRAIFETHSGSPLKTWRMLGGNPEKFSLSALEKRIEKIESQRLRDLERLGKPFEPEISGLVVAAIGQRPVGNAMSLRIYDARRNKLRNEILGVLQKIGRLPTFSELMKSTQE